MENTIAILNSQAEDIDTIFDFYDIAVAYQKKVFNKHWQGFSRTMVAREIEESRQFKILVNDKVACVFAITFNDPQIWEERDQQPSVYIHRIVSHPDFRGSAFVKNIVDWAKNYASKNKLEYVRMDTWADNAKLLAYYTSFGFQHVGEIEIKPNSGLPKHYEGISLNLFEIKV